MWFTIISDATFKMLIKMLKAVIKRKQIYKYVCSILFCKVFKIIFFANATRAGI